jgi:hypothetical protein
VKGCDQEHDAQPGNGYALKDTQRTRLEAELVLGIKGVSEQRDTRAKAREIDQPEILQHAAIVLERRGVGINSLRP